MSSGIRVTMRHVRQTHMCSRGARAFFTRYGLDWTLFLREGLPVEVVEETGDAMALQAAKAARAEQEPKS